MISLNNINISDANDTDNTSNKTIKIENIDMTSNSNKNKIKEIKNKYLLSLENYKKNYIAYNKNITSNEYEIMLSDNEIQINNLIKEMKNLGLHIQTKINQENIKFDKINKNLNLKKNFFNKLKTNNLNDNVLSSKLLVTEVKDQYKYLNLNNIELFFGSIILLICIFLFSKKQKILENININNNNTNIKNNNSNIKNNNLNIKNIK